MELNAYQPCPCHSEQKIKFCCGKQMVDDLNQVMAIARGHQTVAVLDKLDRLIAERGPKDCLLTLKTHFLLSLMEVDKARECNEQFLRSNPKHPIGMQHRAMICLAENKLGDAITALQDAMDGVKGTAVPVALGNAFRLVGLELLRHGLHWAARKHLAFALSLNKDDEQATMLILQSLRLPSASPLEKLDLHLPDAPADAPWTKTFQQLQRLAARGQWRIALQYLEQKLLPQYPDAATLLRAQATLWLWLGRNDRSRAAWEALAALPGLPDDDAIEAWLWASRLLPQESSRQFNVVRVAIPVTQLESLLERLGASDRCIPIPADGMVEEGSPPPKAAYMLLDRPPSAAADTISLERLPIEWTELLVFGRQTDRPPRVELEFVHDDLEEKALAEFQGTYADELDIARTERVVIGQVSEKDFRMAIRWRAPSGSSPEQFEALERATAKHLLLEVWPRIPLALLQGKAPLDVAGQANYRTRLEALVYEWEAADQEELLSVELLGSLRERLGLPPFIPGSIAEFFGKNPNVVRLMRSRWETAEDVQVVAMFYFAAASSQSVLMRKVAREVLRRPHLDEQLPFEQAYLVLAQLSHRDEDCLSYIRQARKAAVAKGQSPGMWLFHELTLRLKHQIADKTPELFEEITRRHMDEPDVAAAMQRLLGAARDRNPARATEEAAPAGEEPASGSILLPQSAGAASGPSRLWVPGMD
jgi:hypothetical protein